MLIFQLNENMLCGMKYIITVFVILVSVIIVILFGLGGLYIFPTTPKNDILLTPRKITDDVNSFGKNFKQKFKNLRKFINENRHRVDNLEISYYLYTYINPEEPYLVKSTQDSWIQSNLDPKYPTIFLLHGFAAETNLKNGTFMRMKDNILRRSVYRNVFIMDYTKYATGLYSELVKMSFLVSQNLANYIQFLIKNANMTADQFHLVGASLGAEVAANAASLIPGLGRVTGLDPLAPIFDLFPPKYRISSDDALFVDVIHTSSVTNFPRGIGISYPVGDLDFYPNGGQHQPGCEDSDKTSGTQNNKNALKITRCNHDRALSLFLESIALMDCQFTGVKCKSFDEFKKGHCTPNISGIAKMGYDALERESLPSFQTKKNFHRGMFYLTTNSEFPFCTNYTRTSVRSVGFTFKIDPSTTYLIFIAFIYRYTLRFFV